MYLRRSSSSIVVGRYATAVVAYGAAATPVYLYIDIVEAEGLAVALYRSVPLSAGYTLFASLIRHVCGYVIHVYRVRRKLGRL